MEGFFQEEDEDEEESDKDEEWRKYFEADALVKEIIKNVKRNDKLRKEILVKKAHFSSI